MISESSLDELLKATDRYSYQKGYDDGLAAQKTLEIGEDMGTVQYVTLVRGKSKAKIKRLLQLEYPGHIDTGCGHDCSGRVCGRYATVLRWTKAYREVVAIVIVSINYDV